MRRWLPLTHRVGWAGLHAVLLCYRRAQQQISDPWQFPEPTTRCPHPLQARSAGVGRHMAFSPERSGLMFVAASGRRVQLGRKRHSATSNTNLGKKTTLGVEYLHLFIYRTSVILFQFTFEQLLDRIGTRTTENPMEKFVSCWQLCVK